VSQLLRRLLVVAAGLLALAPAAHAGVQALQPFPTDLQTVVDPSQPTGLRVNLPLPNCTTNPSDCADVAVLNGLDGFNLQPRVSVPFSGPIDLSTVSDSTVRLYDTSCLVCAPVGIDQTVWEPAANTLHFEPDRFLKEGTTYVLVVTSGLKDASGHTIAPMTFPGSSKVSHALGLVARFLHVTAASVFTTQTATNDLVAIRRHLDATAPPAATIEGTFPVLGTSIVFHRQVGTASFSDSALPVTALLAVPPGVGSIVFGSYPSPQYENAARVIGTTPSVQSTETIQFSLFLPSTSEPPGGYPVAVYGHGFTDNKNGSPFALASSLAAQGIATIAINVVGHGGGAAGTLIVTSGSTTTTIPAGGRGIDQDGNGTIDSTEGVNAAPPFTLVSNRDGLRQTVIDIMQLVRVIHAGGIAHLSPARIYYFGQSFGGIYGTILLGVDPLIRAGVPNVAGGPIVEVARLGGFRPLVGIGLLSRVPSLYNAVPNAPLFTNFVENMPLRGLPILVDTTPGASAIAENLDRNEWAQNAGNPVAYASRIKAPVIFQFAKGDRTVPNPTTTAILRAGNLAARATYFRNDIAGPGGTQLYANPHTFLTSIPALSAFQAQAQIATFFATDGAVTIDPDGAGPVFETPIAGPLPEGLN
jgi:hypothetical protein